MAGPPGDGPRQQTACHLLASFYMQSNILSHMIRWLLERIEHFPIPVEEALWAYAYCMSGPPGHEGFSFPLPSCGAGGAGIHDEQARPPLRYRPVSDLDLSSAGAGELASSSITG